MNAQVVVQRAFFLFITVLSASDFARSYKRGRSTWTVYKINFNLFSDGSRRPLLSRKRVF